VAKWPWHAFTLEVAFLEVSITRVLRLSLRGVNVPHRGARSVGSVGRGLLSGWCVYVAFTYEESCITSSPCWDHSSGGAECIWTRLQYVVGGRPGLPFHSQVTAVLFVTTLTLTFTGDLDPTFSGV
jgi:hypothetical protein